MEWQVLTLSQTRARRTKIKDHHRISLCRRDTDQSRRSLWIISRLMTAQIKKFKKKRRNYAIDSIVKNSNRSIRNSESSKSWNLSKRRFNKIRFKIMEIVARCIIALALADVEIDDKISDKLLSSSRIYYVMYFVSSIWNRPLIPRVYSVRSVFLFVLAFEFSVPRA